MFLYWALFDDTALNRTTYIINAKSCFATLQALEDRLSKGEGVEGCIAYYIGKENSHQKCYEVNNARLSLENGSFRIIYDALNQLDIESRIIANGLYQLAKSKDWITIEEKYIPVISLLSELEFNRLKNSNGISRKYTKVSSVIKEHKAANRWKDISNIFEPLERIKEDNPYDIWSNAGDLYELAFACSKLGEPKTGMERNKEHLEIVARYRQYSISFYKRCEELEPMNFQHPSALGYRYYLNMLELTKQRGRRDGKVNEEIDNAISYFSLSLTLKPNSIKDRYRYGKTLMRKMKNFMWSSERSWSQEDFQNLEEINRQIEDHFTKAIEYYRAMPDNKRNPLTKDFVKVLYNLACHFIETIDLCEKDYIKNTLFSIPKSINFKKQDLENIRKAKEYIEECCVTEYPTFFEKDISDINWVNASVEWTISSMDKFYRLGLIYLTMYYVKKVRGVLLNQEQHYESAEKYLRQARNLGDTLRRQSGSGRSTWHISEKLAWLYILHNDYEKAINLLRPAKDGYVKNTYVVALVLTNKPANYNIAERLLLEALNDSYNLQSSWSATLLCWLYELTNQEEKKQKFLIKNSHSLKKTYIKLISHSPEEEYEG